MSDNSPEFFEELANDWVECGNENLIAALRSAATLARENTELRAQITEALESYPPGAIRRIESAESANRALQAEVDRMRANWASSQWTYDECNAFLRASQERQAEVDKLREKLMALIAVLPDTRKLLIAREDAIAATGHEPQESPHD